MKQITSIVMILRKGIYMKKVRTFKTIVTKAFALFLCLSFIFQQSLIVPVLASEITPDNSAGMGANINNPVDGVYDITAGFTHGSTDFGHFDQFNLTPGDVANLINSVGINKFVALVNNQVNINGLLNILNSGGVFNNGHAVFVSPSGIVIGASGVLNVGALSLITPSQGTYNNFVGGLKANPTEDLTALKTDSQGNITINGKIIARGDVEMYGKDITIAGDGNSSAGILAGLGDKLKNQVLTADNAEQIFNGLVSNAIQDPTGFGFENGKVVIKAQAVNNHAPDSNVTSAGVNIKNAAIVGKDIDISATASDTLETTADEAGSVKDIVLNIDKYFDMENPYEDFTGARAEAVINIENSKLAAADNINISTNASATTNISSADKPSSALVLALGNSTKSTIDIKNTKINAGGDLNANAVSENISEIEISNEAEDSDDMKSKALIAVNHTSKADTHVVIDNQSTIKADNLNVKAVNATNNNISVTNTVKYEGDSKDGKKAGGSATSSAGVSLLLKNDRISTNAEVNANTELKGDAKVTAQNLHVSNTAISASGAVAEENDKESEKSDTDTSGIFSKIQDILASFSQAGVDSSNPTSGASASGSGTPAAEMSGVVNINKSEVTTTASIGSTDFNAGGDVSVDANTIDYTTNSASAESTDGAKFAPGAAVIVDSQNNTTKAVIKDNSKVSAKSVKLNATTELPLTLAELKLNILDKSFSLNPQSNGNWDFSGFEGSGDDYAGIDLSDLDFGFIGEDGSPVEFSTQFFNNQATSAANGVTTGIAGAVVYNSIVNDTTASIGNNAVVTASQGDIIANAVNSVVNYNAAGDVSALFKQDDKANGGKFGLGGSVLINNYTNNATASIGKNATVTAGNGKVELTSANEASYMNLVSSGAQAGKFALAGSVLVNNINGNTESKIGEQARVKAAVVNVKAGQGQIKTAANTDGLKDDSLELNQERSAKDKTSVINIGGAISQQKARKGQSSGKASSGGNNSSGAAIGATVMVNNINKNVKASIGNNAEITATKSVDIKANTETGTLNIGLAGAFTGGVKTKKPASKDSSSQGQDFGNFGNWQDSVGNITDRVENAVSSTDNTVNNATGSSLTDHLQGSDVQGALGSTNNTPNDVTPGTSGTTSQGQNLAGHSGNLMQNEDGSNAVANGSTATNSFSTAAAGVVNVNSNETNVEASIGNATINVGDSLNVEASQDTQGLDIATGVSKAGNLGAGAAINVNSKAGSTNALMNGTNVIFTGSGDRFSVIADETNNNIAVALGVGAAKGGNNTQIAIGGSFNTNLIENSVKSSMNDVDVEGKGNTEIEVIANNYSKSYKGAGGVAYAGGKSNSSGGGATGGGVSGSGTSDGGSTGVGAGVAGNIDVYNKTTKAEITSSEGNKSKLTNVGNVSVEANNKGGATDDVIGFSMGGAISGANTSANFAGAIGVVVFGNEVSALIKNADISSIGDINVNADSNLNLANITGSASISKASKGAGVGIGTVVNVINNIVIAGIEDTIISKSKSVNVNAKETEVLQFLAANLGFNAGVDAKHVGVYPNAIVSVLDSDIKSYITGGSVTSDGNVASKAAYDSDIKGITAVLASDGFVVGGNIVSNVLTNSTTSNVNSTVSAGGQLSSVAEADENIDVIAAGAAISSGKLAVAANIGVNVLDNTTDAKLGGNVTKSGSVNVNASDTTNLKTRGGTLSGSAGTGVGGSIIVDVLVKDVSASISDGANINSDGNVNVNASAKNYSGGDSKLSINLADILNNIDNIDLENYEELKDWQMTYDLVGGGSTALSGSLITKVVNNNVTASVGNAVVNSGSLNVAASDDVVINAIVGNISGGAGKTIGGSAFVNVVTGTTEAKIAKGANVTTTSKDVSVTADNKQSIRTIMVMGGGGQVAVNGSANVNVFNNNTLATVEDGVTIDSKGAVKVDAAEKTEVESINIAASAGSNIAAGGVIYVNTFSSDVKATVGKKEGEQTSITAGGDIDVNADSKSAFGATMMMAGLGGTAGVSGAAVVNVVDAVVSSYVVNSLLSNAGHDINVLANSNFNNWKYSNNSLYDTMSKSESYLTGKIDEIDMDNFTPIVNILSLSGAGTAAVGAVAVANTVTNNVSAVVENSNITNTNSLNVSATTASQTYDALASLAGSGVASVTGSALVNLIEGETKAAVIGTTVERGSVYVNAADNAYMDGILLGVAGAGTAAVTASVNTNLTENKVNAVIDESTIRDADKVSVKSESNKKASTLASGIAVSGGAGVNGLVIVNQNETENNAKITNSTIKTKNDVKVEGKSSFKTFDALASAGVSTVAVNAAAISNIAANKNTASIENTNISESGSVTVNAESTNDIKGNNISLGVGGGAIGLSALVNLVESETKAFINNSDPSKIIKTAALNVKANDSINLDMNVGVLTAGGVSAAGAANVNIINNAVLAEIKSQSEISASSVNVNAVSDMDINILTASAAVGAFGGAASVAVTSIGGKFDDSNTDAYLKTDDGGNLVDKAISQTGVKVSENSKGGTVANVNANIKSDGDVNVKASNNLNLDKTNAQAVAGFGSLAGNVLVTNMKYNTSASMQGDVTGKNISVNANNTVKANTTAYSASLSGVNFGGNVAYFTNDATTSAAINGGTIKGTNVAVNATSKDTTSVNSTGASVSGANINATVALTESNNKVSAAINNKVNINADKLDVIADNTSSLTSELASLSASVISGQVVINKAESSAITSAIVDATGTINAADMNVITSTGGISAKSIVNMGGVSLAGVDVTSQGAIVKAQFNSAIKGDAEIVNKNSDKTGSTNVYAGVKTGTTEAGEIKAEASAKQVKAGLAGVGVTSLNANVSAKTDVTINPTNLKTDNLNVFSKLNRTANVGSESGSLSAIELSTLDMDAYAGGSNTITFAGNTEVEKAINVQLGDKANVNTSIMNQSISLVGANVNTADAVIDTDTTINIGGNLSMDNMTVNSNVERNTVNSSESSGGGFVDVNSYKMTTNSGGDSTINITANIQGDSKNAVDVTSTAKNTANTRISSKSAGLAAIAKNETKNTITATNKINVNGANIKTNGGDISIKADSENRVLMRQNEQGAGAIVIRGGKINNSINSIADVEFNNANIEAENVNVSASAKLGTIGDKEISYRVGVSGFSATHDADISNDITQNSNIKFNNSTVKAKQNMNVKARTESTLKQKIYTEGDGFVTKNVATSNLKVTNNNNITISKGSTLEANDLNLAMDSKNILHSESVTNADHFGGLDPEAHANLELTINNTINNSGELKGKDTVQINFMKDDSVNELTQLAELTVDAAVATGDADGYLKYNVNNNLNVNEGASISSGKDVAIRYSDGDYKLNSRVHSKKTSYLLFGIPITVEDDYSNVSRGGTSKLTLNGEITAGSESKYNFEIDRDGNVVEHSGFEDKYEKVDSDKVISAEQQEKDNEKVISEVKDEIENINNEIAEMKKNQEANSKEIAEYEQKLEQYQTLLDSLNANKDNTITMDNIENQIKDKVNEKIEDADNFWSNYNKYANEHKGEGGDLFDKYVDTLSIENKAEVKSAYHSVADNITTDAESGLAIFKQGDLISIISDKDSVQESIDRLEQVVNNYTQQLNNLKIKGEGLISSIQSNSESLSAMNDQLKYLEDLRGSFTDTSVGKPYFKFDNLDIPNAKIEISGIDMKVVKDSNGNESLAPNIEGNGNFHIFAPTVEVTNYSDYDLVFGNINYNTSGNSGLIINDVTYNHLANKDTPVADNVHLLSGDTTGDFNPGISIKNLYDHNNPVAGGSIVSNIIMNGLINFNNGYLSIWNESGDITIKSLINTASKDIIATQGNAVYTGGGSFEIKENDRFVAGKDVTVNASNIKVDGLVQAGYGDRNIVITEDMIKPENLVVDPNTGEKNMVDTAYLDNSNGNIKVLYVDGKLLVFNTQQEGGNVNFTGSVSGSGTVKYTDGFANVNIQNKTDKELVVNNLANDRMNGQFTNRGSLKSDNIINQGHSEALTNIDSNGKISILGFLKHGHNRQNTDGAGQLTIKSDNGIAVNEKRGSNGELLATVDSVGNTVIENGNNSGITIDGKVLNDGAINVKNNGSEGVSVNSIIENSNGTLKVDNTQGNVTISEKGTLQNSNGNIEIKNTGEGKVSIIGKIKNLLKGDTKIDSQGEQGIEISGTVTNTDGIVEISNKKAGVTISGLVENKKGKTTVKNEGSDGIKVTSAGKIQNNNGQLELENTGKGGMKLEGKVKTSTGDIKLTNKDSDIVIGHKDTDFNIESGSNVVINQTNGDVLNAGVDKTLISAASDLIMTVNGGSVGKRAQTDKPAYSIDASTRDYTKSLNVNIKGKVNIEANAKDGVKDSGLVNLTAKKSDLNVDKIKTDGDIVLTAADWKYQDEENPDPNNDPYYRGYSIRNASTDKSQANLEGKNISVISSNEIGEKGNALTYNQRTDLDANAKVGFEAENDIYLDGSAKGDKTNIAYLVSKRGSIDFALGSDAEIHEITSNNHLHIQSRAKNLTIYNLGKLTSLGEDFNDLLYPHDKIKLGGNSMDVVPQTVAIEVLDANGGAEANSTLKIYNAYVRGANNGKGSYEQYLDQTFQTADVSLMADNIYAHAYDAAKSDVYTNNRPGGFDPTLDTVYTDLNGNEAHATGFNTVGEGAKLSFDLQGVSREMVKSATGDDSTRSYNETDKFQTIEFFNNKYQIPDGKAYKAHEVTLSVNSSDESEETGNNRGLNINKIYADNAYVDTKDLNLSVRDGLITNYAEFRNGNRFGEGNYPGDYRWLTVVDNDFRRLVDSTLQLYTEKTGSFGLDMGNLVILRSKAPAVNYNPYEVANLFRNENSFYRLTYKDDKIQYNTTTPDFKDIDKATYKATKRVSMRFPTKDQNLQSNVAVYDISKTGALIDNPNNLKIGDKKHVKLLYEDMDIDVDVEVVRITDNGFAGVKFINMNKSTANKILYLNLSRANSMKENYTSQLP